MCQEDRWKSGCLVANGTGKLAALSLSGLSLGGPRPPWLADQSTQNLSDSCAEIRDTLADNSSPSAKWQ